LNLSYFISKRITASNKDGFSSTIHKIAVWSIGIGLATMIVSFLILKGFQTTVKNKIYSFSSHLQVTKYTMGNSLEELPISVNNQVFNNPQDYPFIEHIQDYAHKAGLIKTEEEVLGVIFKGVSNRFDLDNFQSSIKAGRFIDFSEDAYAKEVLVSSEIARKIEVDVDDEIVVHFFMNPPRVRKLKVVGIYETNLSDYYDDKFIIGDLGLIQRLNNWPDSLAGGMEIFIKDINKVDQAERLLDELLPYDLFVEKIEDKYIQIFDWLNLISRQVNLFLGIILFVVCVNMISIVLILIMERTQMIGLLKAMGAKSSLIRKIFAYSGMQLILKGLILGNGLGIGICMLQYFFQIIPLNPKDYYMSYVPIGWDVNVILLLNLLTFIVVSLIIFIPTSVVARINPLKSIKFD